MGLLSSVKYAVLTNLPGGVTNVILYDNYTYSKVAPHRVEAVTALTALTIYLTTAVIVFKKIRGAN